MVVPLAGSSILCAAGASKKSSMMHAPSSYNFRCAYGDKKEARLR